MLNKDQFVGVRLHNDSEPEKQPENTYSFALNAVDDSKEGSMGSMVNEKGNLYVGTVEGDDVKGSIRIDAENIALFTYGSSSKIWLFNPKTNDLDLVVDKPELNFRYKITGESRIIKGCEKVIYFGDGENYDRFFNFDNAEDFKTNGDWDLNKFRFNPSIIYPNVTSFVRSSGGLTEYGTYFFVLEYLDDNENVRYKTLPLGRSEIGVGLNIEDYSADIGGKPKSSESIELTISNIDPSFSYIRVNVISYTGNNNSVQAFTIGNLLTIRDSQMTYIFTGFNADAGDQPVDVASLTISAPVYNNSKVKVQVSNRLLRANLKENVIDYSSFQRAASKIFTQYSVESKQKSTEKRTDFTEMGDQVKAYFIHYLFSDGTISPGFHIPGRPKLFAADDEETIIKQNVIVKPTRTDPGVVINETVPFWKSHNTATAPDDPDNPALMGYYQSDTLYTNPPNICSDEDYWGEDYWGNSLEGTNIRHHKIPSRNIVPLIEGNKLNYIGVKFSNVEYPHPDIVGHFFSSKEGRHVIAAGVAMKFVSSNPDFSDHGRYVIPGLSNTGVGQTSNVHDLKVINFITWDYLFNNTSITGDILRIVGEYDYTYTEINNIIDDYFNKNVPYENLQMKHRIYTYKQLNPYLDDDNSVIAIDSYRNVQPQTYDPTYDYRNASQTSKFNLIRSIDSFNSDQFDYGEIQFRYCNAKSFVDTLSNINTLQPEFLNDEPFVLSSSNDEFIIFNGGYHISKTVVTNISWLNFGFNFLTTDNVKIDTEVLRDMYIESKTNAALRLETTNIDNSFSSGNFSSLNSFFAKKISENVMLEDERGYVVKDSIPEEWYGYNSDYNISNRLVTKVPLPFSYDYCSECLNRYPNRILFSLVAYDNDVNDNFLINRPLDFVDIPANRGEIIDIDYKNNQLIVRTTETCIFIQPSPQQLQASESTIHLGTGDFLSLPPRELNQSDIGYGGQQDVFASCNTPYGLFWIDNTEGKLFKLGGDFKEANLEDLYRYLRNNLPPYKPFGYDVSNTQLTYDAEFSRIIIHKEDYALTEKGKALEGNVTFSNGKFELTSSGINGVRDADLSFDNKEYFINKSFTLSYDVKKGLWKSWHSWQPDYMFYSNETFFAVNKGDIYKAHANDKYNNYFGTQYPYIIEFVVKDFNTFFTHAIHYYSNFYKFNKDSETFVDEESTFDKLLVYNNKQSTGIVDVVIPDNPYDTIFFSNALKYAIETDQNIKISGIYDIAEAIPVESKHWNDIRKYYINGQGYMDKEPININFDKPLHELSEIKDKWVKVRLIYTGGDYKIVTNIIETLKFYSVR